MADLLHRHAGVSVRYLRTPDAAAHRQGCTDGFGAGPQAGHAGVYALVSDHLFCARHLRWHLWFAGRLLDRSVWPTAGADLQHSALCGGGVLRGLFHHAVSTALFPVPRVHRRVRGVCGGGGLVVGTVPRPRAARKSFGLHPSLLLGRWPHGGDCLRLPFANRQHRRRAAGDARLVCRRAREYFR